MASVIEGVDMKTLPGHREREPLVAAGMFGETMSYEQNAARRPAYQLTVTGNAGAGRTAEPLGFFKHVPSPSVCAMPVAADADFWQSIRRSAMVNACTSGWTRQQGRDEAAGRKMASTVEPFRSLRDATRCSQARLRLHSGQTNPGANLSMARQFIYHMSGLNKSYGAKKILENVNLSFYPDAKIGILGPNGAGKSTVLRIIAGQDKEFTGEAWLAEGATVGYLEQEPKLDPAKTAFENVMEGVADKQAVLDRYNELMMNYSDETADEGAKLQDIIDSQNLWDLEQQVEMAMEALRCPPKDADVNNLSGGERRRIALCRLLLSQPDLLLLDEPTNHLDAETIAWLEKHLRDYPGAVMMITHDRYFLDNVTGWILELDRGRGIPYEGNYSAYLTAKAKRMQQEAREEAGRQKALSREQEWIASSPKARQAKSKARIKAYEQLVDAAEGIRPGDAQIIIPVSERLGNVVIEMEGITKGFEGRTLINDLSIKLPPGGIVGIIGPNGAGKTTLFKMITGQEQPDGGSIRIGDTVHLGYVDQSRDALDGDKTVWEEISGGAEVIKLGKFDMNSRAYCGAFNFKGGDQQQKVGNLSGGQRNRVHLAKMLKAGGNVLLLDEPTNDLDTETLGALESALEAFAGCAIIISHDRMFLDRLATHILAFEGDGHVEWFEGNFEDYEQDKIRRLGPDALNPGSQAYKRLTR
jgi:ATP-binding cassette ChvD family protein